MICCLQLWPLVAFVVDDVVVVVVVVVVVGVVCMTLAVWRHKIDGVHKAFCRTAVHVPHLLNQFTNVGGAEVEVGQFHSITDA